MRPLRLELVGFSAFRDRTEVDFDGVDLFAFVGATGAGKSSLIDAMVFALYGSVPRYDNANLVHPVITQGAVEARVRLDFEVGDERYSATRVVVRTKTGATTKEARLEHGNTVLADDAKGMTVAVTELLGLDLGQFTKCVVLPQGAFATLLHDAKADRQKLLVKLLDLGLYSQVAALARSRAKDADSRVGLLDEQLTALDGVDEAIGIADVRGRTLSELVSRIDDAAPVLDEAVRNIAEAERDLAEKAKLRAVLGKVRAPDGIDKLAESLESAAGRLHRAEAAEVAAAERVAAATSARVALGDPAELRAQRDAWNRLDDLESRVTKGIEVVDAAEADLVPLTKAAAEADDALAQAAAALDSARLSHAAAGVAASVSVGDDCPVCGNEVHDLVQHDDGAVTSATDSHAVASTAAKKAQQALVEAERNLAGLRSKLDDRTTARDEAAKAVASAPAPVELETALAAIETAEAELNAARSADTEARDTVRTARAAHAAANDATAKARSDYHSARDAVAAAGPPPSGDDLVADWTALVTWAGAAESDAADAEKALNERRAAADAERRRITDELVAAADQAGVPVPDPARVRDHCVQAQADATAEAKRLTTERDRLVQVAATRAELAEQRDVHELLSRELGARGFEAWLLDEALEVLLEGASTWLEQLSSGRYALAVDDKHTFVVVDHANADERRLARTLSGGETFLASLALALALAERITELSATGGRRLDAIFLDEGFGTLDADTLDVVATAIEELGSTGRMVGIISHVPELAERVPVRFAVTRGATSSAVERQER